jgi:hypothetical protein
MNVSDKCLGIINCVICRIKYRVIHLFKIKYDVVPSADTVQDKDYLLLHISCTTSRRGYDLSNYFYGFISLIKVMETTFSVIRILIQTVKNVRLTYKDYISQTHLI